MTTPTLIPMTTPDLAPITDPDTALRDVQTLALYNPKLAYMLTRGQPMETRYYPLTITFEEDDADQVLRDGQFAEKMFQFFWVRHIFYTVRRPEYRRDMFAIYEQDEYAKRNPYVDVRLRLVGRERYTLTEGFVPLESVADPMGAHTPRHYGLVLTDESNVSIDAQLTRPLEDGEAPYIVHLVFVGQQLSGCELANCGYDAVVCQLRQEGLYPYPADTKNATR